jgi:hypothetical protein
MFYSDKPILKQLVVKLPEDAVDVYYRDEVGNVSTSHYRPGHLELIPRYPVFGGWNTTWYHGYNVELGERLRVAPGGRFVFREAFVTPVEGAAFDEVTVRVVLPEGVQLSLQSCFFFTSRFRFSLSLSPPFFFLTIFVLLLSFSQSSHPFCSNGKKKKIEQGRAGGHPL